MRFLSPRRGLLAVILLVTLPLRGFAIVAAPCCPLVAASTDRAPAAGPPMDAMHDAHDDEGDRHAHATAPDCCAVALPATPVASSLPAYASPRAASPPPVAVVALPGEPPERPPRTLG